MTSRSCSNDDVIQTRDIIGLTLAVAIFVGCIVWMTLAPTQSEYEMVSVVVRPGDTLWSLARQYAPGLDPRQAVYIIRTANGGLDPGRLQPGDVVLIPSEVR